MKRHYAAGLVLVGFAQATALPAKQVENCLSVVQAEALVTYMLPTAVQAGRNKCAATLPPAASLFQRNSERLARYRAASETAWPQAKKAVAVLAGEKLPPGIDDALLRPIADAMITKLVGDEIKSKDCALIGKIYSDLEPMPPANLASLAVTLVQATTRNGQKRDIPICKTPV